MPSGNIFTNNPDFIRRTLRTPGILIFGLVMAPCGWILTLTSTVAPTWRMLQNFPNQPSIYVIEQGIWDVCVAAAATQDQKCKQPDSPYFSNYIVSVAQGMMLGSLILTLIGICFAIPGVRCWKDKPQWLICAVAGVLLFLSGVLAIIPLSWYNYIIGNITSVYSQNGLQITVGYAIVLGYIGGIFEVLGGLVMVFGLCRCCKGWNRDEIHVDAAMDRAQRRQQPQQYPPRPERRRVEIPSLSRTRSSAGSGVPYSKDSLDDDVSFPRAKSPAARSGVSSNPATPYDADL